MLECRLMRELRAINEVLFDPTRPDRMLLTRQMYEYTVEQARKLGTASVDELVRGYEYMLNLCGVMEDVDKILEVTERALALQPTYYFAAVFYNYRAVAYLLKGQNHDAISAAKQGLSYARQSNNDQLVEIIEVNLRAARSGKMFIIGHVIISNE